MIAESRIIRNTHEKKIFCPCSVHLMLSGSFLAFFQRSSYTLSITD